MHKEYEAEFSKEFSPFTTTLNTILNQSVSPDTIDTYASNALNQIIQLVDDVVLNYSKHPTINYETLRQQEEAAFRYHSLGNIEKILDHVADKVAELQNIDSLIEDIPTFNQVILPPGESEVYKGIAPESNESVQRYAQRLKTLLFILQNEFNIDVFNDQQLKMSKGRIDNTQVRNESYAIVEAYPLNKTVLICDETGNATFIFDTNETKTLEITTEQLANLTKSEVVALLYQYPRLGSRLVQRNTFVKELIDALSSAENSVQKGSEAKGSYLIPRAPEEILSANQLSKKVGISNKTMYKVIDSILDQLGDIDQYKFGAYVAPGYTPKQQAIIIIASEERWTFKNMRAQQQATNKSNEKIAPMPPEGYLTIRGISKQFSADRPLVSAAISEVQDELGEVKSFVFAARYTQGYSPEQIEIIHRQLEINGVFVELAPEGYMSAGGIASDLGVSHRTVKAAIEELGDILTNFRPMKFHAVITTGYSPDDKNMIIEKIKSNGSGGLPPEGYLSRKGMVDEWSMGSMTIDKAVDAVWAQLGNVEAYRFGQKTVHGFSVEQQEIIRNWLEEQGLMAEVAPENVMNITHMQNEWGNSVGTITKAIDEAREQLGAIRSYKFGSRTVPGYLPNQVAIIRDTLVEKKLYASEAPEGFLSLKGFERESGFSVHLIKKASKVLRDQLGPLESYRFSRQMAVSFSPRQRGIILSYLTELLKN